MCVALPGRVVEVTDPANGLVTVDIAGMTRTVSTAVLDESIDVGDWLEVHSGFALAKITDDEAQEILGFARELDRADREGIAGEGDA
jgi:hydrogenase expression/formation protein HypC